MSAMNKGNSNQPVPDMRSPNGSTGKNNPNFKPGCPPPIITHQKVPSTLPLRSNSHNPSAAPSTAPSTSSFSPPAINNHPKPPGQFLSSSQNLSVWQPACTSRPTSPSQSRQASPTTSPASSNPPSPRESIHIPMLPVLGSGRGAADSNNTPLASPNKHRTGSSEFEDSSSSPLDDHRLNVRRPSRIGTSIHPSGAQTMRNFSSQRIDPYDDSAGVYNLQGNESTPSETRSGSTPRKNSHPVPPTDALTTRPEPPRRPPPSSSTPTNYSGMNLPLSGINQSTSPPDAGVPSIAGTQSGVKILNSVTQMSSNVNLASPRSNSPSLGAPPTPPPHPHFFTATSKVTSLSGGVLSASEAKMIKKELKKKEKEEKKAKKKEEKEEKKALKEAKKSKSKDKTGSPSKGASTPSSPRSLSPSKLHFSDNSTPIASPASHFTISTPASTFPQYNQTDPSSPTIKQTNTTPNISATSPISTNNPLSATTPVAPSSPTISTSPKQLLQTLAKAEEHGAPILPDPRPLSPEPAPPKTSLSDFRIIKLIGKGGFGEVYLVEHIAKRKKMALKVLDKSHIASEHKAQQIINERAVLVKGAQNPFLLSLNYSFQDQKFLYFAMKYCPGGDLRALLSAIGAFEEEEARLYIAEMILSVDALHKLGYIHRDLKPDNFLIDERGHLVLADFGLSKYAGQRQSTNPINPKAPLRERALSTIINNNPSADGTYSMLLGPQNLETLNADNLNAKFRRTKTTKSNMMGSFNPLTMSYNPSETNSSGGFAAGSFENDPFMGGSYNPLLTGSYNPLTRTFNPNVVRPVVHLSDLPTKSQQRRLMAYSIVGSPDYMSPEVLAEHGYGAEVDWWSVGCLCFELVLGVPPFTADSIKEVFNNIANWETRLPQILEQYQSYLSPQCFDLLQKLLCEPSKRLGTNGISELKRHPFFEGLNWDKILEEEPPFVPRLADDEDTSYFEANVVNKTQVMLPKDVPAPTNIVPDAPSPNDYYKQFSYNEADLLPLLQQMKTGNPS